VGIVDCVKSKRERDKFKCTAIGRPRFRSGVEVSDIQLTLHSSKLHQRWRVSHAEEVGDLNDEPGRLASEASDRAESWACQQYPRLPSTSKVVF